MTTVETAKISDDPSEKATPIVEKKNFVTMTDT